MVACAELSFGQGAARVNMRFEDGSGGELKQGGLVCRCPRIRKRRWEVVPARGMTSNLGSAVEATCRGRVGSKRPPPKAALATKGSAGVAFGTAGGTGSILSVESRVSQLPCRSGAGLNGVYSNVTARSSRPQGGRDHSGKKRKAGEQYVITSHLQGSQPRPPKLVLASCIKRTPYSI